MGSDISRALQSLSCCIEHSSTMLANADLFSSVTGKVWDTAGEWGQIPRICHRQASSFLYLSKPVLPGAPAQQGVKAGLMSGTARSCEAQCLFL